MLSFRWYRGELGVGADRANGHELLHSEVTSIFHQLDAHDCVVIKEPATVCPVCSNASNHGCQMIDDVRLRFLV